MVQNRNFSNLKQLAPIFVAFLTTCTVVAVADSTEVTASATPSTNTGFRPALDTYITSESNGYGVYEVRQSNVFRPGETLILYVEPEGMTYRPITEGNDQLYNIKMSADIIISDNQGNVLAEIPDLPLMNIVSHYQNKELNLDLSVEQQSPFPPGDYVIKYVVTDDNSGESFEITKNIAISGQ